MVGTVDTSLRAFRVRILRTMSLGAMLIGALVAITDVITVLTSDVSPIILLAGLIWGACAVGFVHTLRLLRADRVDDAATSFLFNSTVVVLLAPLTETSAGTFLILSLGCPYVIFTALAVQPPRLHNRWKLGMSAAFAIVLMLRHALRPMPEFVGVLELIGSSVAGAIAVFALSTIGQALVQALRDALDVTVRNQQQLEQMNADLELARDEALAASKAKADFLANMSHELRTPLNAIVGYSEMLIEEAEDQPEADPQSLEDLQSIHTAGGHLLAVISDILDLTKIESGHLDLHLSQVNIRQLAADLQSTVRPLVARRGNRLSIELSDDLSTLGTDKAKLQTVLLNLLGNAVKFTENGEIKLSMATEAHEDGRQGLVAEVTDTGVGVAPDHMDQLFDPFTQADTSSTRQFGGAGLGLAICQHLCTALGGEVTAHSDGVGQGSTFRVWLPSLPVPRPALDPPTSRPTPH